MRVFGRFKSDKEVFYGEVVGSDVRVLRQPYWLGAEPAGPVRPLTDLTIDVPVAPSKKKQNIVIVR